MASIISRALSPFPLRKLRDRKKSPKKDSSLNEPSFRHFSPTPDEICFDDQQSLYLGGNTPLTTLPPVVPPSPSPIMRSIGVQTPTLSRRGFPNMPGDATPTPYRRKLESARLNSSSSNATNSLRGLFQSLTPRMRRKRCPYSDQPVSESVTSSMNGSVTPSMNSSSSMTLRAKSSSSTPSPVSWAEEEITFPPTIPPQDEGTVTVIEVGAAGLHFGKRSYKNIPIRDLNLQDSYEEDTLEREPKINRARRRRRKKRNDSSQRGNSLRNKRVSFIAGNLET